MNALKIGFFSTLALGFATVQPAIAEESVAYKILLSPLLQTGTDILGEPIVYPPGKPKITAAIVTIPSGGETGWHTHEVPLFARVVSGEVTVDYGDKGTKVYKVGESFMEAMNWPHNGKSTGKEPVEILVVYMGSEDEHNAVSVPAPEK